MTTQDDPAEQADREAPLPATPPAAPPLIDWLDQLTPERRRRVEEALERGRADPGGITLLIPSPRPRQP